MWTIRASVAAIAFAIVLSSAVAAADEPERTRPAALVGSSLTWCGDLEPIRAAPDAYRDSPVYVGNDQPEEVITWAREQPGFVDVWIDRDNLGWLTVAFSRDADARQAELSKRFPDAGAVAVSVRSSAEQLRRAHRLATRVLRGSPGSVATRPSHNVIEVGVQTLTPLVVANLERLSRAPVCIDGGDPADRPPAGPQPTEGDGWRLVGHREGRGKVFRTGIAADEDGYRRLWHQAGMRGKPAEVDFTGHVVLWFAEPHGSGCPIRRLDDVVVDLDTALVHPLFVDPEANMTCTDDLAGAWQFLVELERHRLPAGPFVIQLGPDDPPSGAPLERTIVDVDLSQPGATASRDEIHPDASSGGPRPLRSGAFIEPAPFGSSDFAFDVRCGIAYLGRINGIPWVSGRTDVPEAWQASIEAGGELVVQVTLLSGPDAHAEATANGETVRYDAVRDSTTSLPALRVRIGSSCLLTYSLSGPTMPMIVWRPVGLWQAADAVASEEETMIEASLGRRPTSRGSGGVRRGMVPLTVASVLAIGTLGVLAPVANAKGNNLVVHAGVGEGTVAGQSYLPGAFTVGVGDTVTFTIGSDDPHTITFGTGPADVAPDAWPITGFDAEPTPFDAPEPADLGMASYDGTGFVNTAVLGPRESTATIEFTVPGTFPFFCAIHPGMAGEVTVVDSGDLTTQEAADAAAAETSEALLSQVDPLREARSAAVTVTDNADGTQTHDVFADASTDVGPQPGGGAGLLELTEFFPADIQIAAGDTISWTASRAHTVTFIPEGTDPASVFPSFEAVFVPIGGPTYDGSAPVNSGVFNIPGPDGTALTEFSLTFPTEGTYPFFCAIHVSLGQLGTVTVGPAASG